MILRVTIALVLLAGVAGGALVLTDAGRGWLRAVKAEAEHRAFLWRMGGVTRQGDIMLPMDDGVRLATDLYLPRAADGPLPTVLMRLPYGKTRFGEVRHWIETFVPRGYAVVVQDMRGRHGSEGVFAPWPNAGADGATTLDWIARQPWSDGQAGTVGCSALGESQLSLGARHPPVLKAMVPMGAGGGVGTLGGLHNFFGVFEGGVPALASSFGWFVGAGGKTPDAMGKPPVNYTEGLATLPIRDAVARFRKDPTDYEALLDGFTDPSFWASWGYARAGDSFAAPMLIVDGWYDQSVQASLALGTHARAGGTAAHTVIGPGTHCDFTGPFRGGAVGDVTVDPAAALDTTALVAAFMDHHLKGAPAPDLPPFHVFVLNADRWLSSETWPPKAATARHFLLDGTGLLEEAVTDMGTRVFVSDPMAPVPTIGGSVCCTGAANLRTGPLDQSPLDGRTDILVYQSEVLDAPMTIAGPISATLYMSTDVPDTDLVARITDFGPDGRSILIQEGALRLRYRDGYDAPTLMEPGVVYAVEIGMRDIAWRLDSGHRLGLQIAGSSFPRLARNMNGGGDPHRESVPQVATITLHHGAETPSAVTVFTVDE